MLPFATRSALVGALLLIVSCAGTQGGNAPQAEPVPQAPNRVDDDGLHIVSHDGDSCALCEIYLDTRNHVVLIRTPTGLGSGIVLTNNGLVATNAHVVDGVREVSIESFDGSKHAGRVVARETREDLALIEIAPDAPPMPPRQWSPVSLHEDFTARVGSDVFLIGHPLGYSWTVTRGVVSAVREVGGLRVIQTDAAISPGNSGGPMLDAEGHLIGIVTSKIVGQGAENIAFARPVSSLRALLAAKRAGTAAP